MCGRARCTLTPAQVARACGVAGGADASISILQMDRYRPSYNVLPGFWMPVFVMQRDGEGTGEKTEAPLIRCMKWGLVPGFTKKSEKPDHYRMFNARSESVKEKASFCRLIPSNRCLVAVEGFYEWKKDGTKKQPYYIHFKDGRSLVFAALYDSWTDSEGKVIYTFTILTTRSSSSLEWLHDRMPVILGNKDLIDAWLDQSTSKFETVLEPYGEPDLVWYPVTPAMGKPSFDGPECVKEIHLRSAVENPLTKFFSKKTDDKSLSKFELHKSYEEVPVKDDPDGLKELDDEETDEHRSGEKSCKSPSKFELQKSYKEFPVKVDPDRLKELNDEETDEHRSKEKSRKSDALIPLKEEAAEKNVCGIKREFEAVENNLKRTSGNFSKFSGPPKNKGGNVKNAGDRQASLHSYFWRS